MILSGIDKQLKKHVKFSLPKIKLISSPGLNPQIGILINRLASTIASQMAILGSIPDRVGKKSLGSRRDVGTEPHSLFPLKIYMN